MPSVYFPREHVLICLSDGSTMSSGTTESVYVIQINFSLEALVEQ